MHIDNVRLGKVIALLRRHCNLSQVQLSQISSLSTVSNVEQGKKGVSVESLNKIAAALEMPAGSLATLATTSDNPAIQSLLDLQAQIILRGYAELKGTEEAALNALEAQFNALDLVEKESAGRTFQDVTNSG